MKTQGDLPVALRVFCIPELAGLICPWVGRHDQATLMRVCRRLHSSVVSFVWDYTIHLSLLLELLPGLEKTPYKLGSSQIKTIRLPSTPDLTRFNIYAPHVKSLFLSSNPIGKCENWHGFYSIARSTTLLPNLSRILLKKPGLSDWQLVIWTSMFLSPSVNDIRSTDRRWFGKLGENMDLEQASELLRSTASVCPSLKLLDIYPSPLPDNQHPDPSHSFFANFCHSIRSFKYLRELSSNTVILEERSFLALGKLPALETLTLYPCAYDETVGNLALPDDAFPALRRLNLQVMNQNSMVELCGLKPLVWRITILGVLPQPKNNSSSLPNLCLAKPMSALAENNSTLSSLLVDEDSFSSPVALEIDSMLLQQFRHFPLKKVTLPIYTFSPGLNLQDLLEVFPTVEELSLKHRTYHETNLEQLRAFHVKLPNLRNLEIGVDFESVWNLSKADFGIPRNQSSTCMRLQCRFRQVGENKNLAKPVARFLHTLWPNAICLPESRLGNLCSEENNEGIRLINAGLFALRQTGTLE
ncbi:hypothetical protein BDV93DRAFT_519138 [Ceratobasidium sp. AG-I]|nr:hypothetical protein BDV93DRAFT_519138 [Ceratobasidium sp. AG-I]